METHAPQTRLRLPAEWEPQDFVQLTWPHEETDWKPIIGEITATYIDMALAIASREDVVIVSQQPGDAQYVLRHAATPEQLARMHFLSCPTDDTWARDHGFLTLTDGERCRFLDFRFNGWGEKFPAEKDNQINARLYASHLLQGDYESQLDFVLEGGSIESDGRGTVFTTAPCLLAPHRNQPLTRQQIDDRLRQALHADRVVWLEHGQLTGDDTDGHIDTLVRVAPDDTLLYVGCGKRRDEQNKELRLLEKELQQLRTTDGRPYRLLRLPMPERMEWKRKRLPATYANFLVINGAVLVPTYRQPETDREAMDIIGQAFPDRDVVGIDSAYIVVQHGSLHCCTMQYPKGSLARPL